ncbi:hypothetical protein T484DRAFT_1751144 [Baffinella frigidus]|nr:hypothetical protein T484DRAFT_1751144 [Cryptophyta sp. CCMP2293]
MMSRTSSQSTRSTQLDDGHCDQDTPGSCLNSAGASEPVAIPKPSPKISTNALPTFSAASSVDAATAFPAPELQKRTRSSELRAAIHDDVLVASPRARFEALIAFAALSSNPASAASSAFLLSHDEVLASKVRVSSLTHDRERKLASCF